MQGRPDPNRELLDAAALCRHLVDPKSVAGFLADHRHRLFPDELFEDLFPSGRGRPSVPAEVVATVMVLQALEGLSDREAAQRVRTDITWKVACGLALDDAGFHPTVLTLWRNRLRASERPQRMFETVREVIDQTGVLTGRRRRALDSTVLDDAVQRQDTITQLTAQIRVVRRLIPEVGKLTLPAHDYDHDRGKPSCAWNDAADVERVVTALVTDAQTVLAAVAAVPLTPAQQEAVGLLALVAGQDVEEGETPGSWRIARKTAPDRVISVHDPESRHAHKTVHHYRDGFKAHIAFEPEVGLVTAATFTAANAGDGTQVERLLHGEPEGLTVLADSAYGSGAARQYLETAGHAATIKPIPLSRLGGQFNLDDFHIDLERGTATCPAGVTVSIRPSRKAEFGRHCTECSLRAWCTTSREGRSINLSPHHRLLVTARRQAETEEFHDEYRRWRPPVERGIAWLVRRGNRRVPYRGVARNRLWLGHRVAAINLRRLVALGLQASPEGGWELSAAPA